MPAAEGTLSASADPSPPPPPPNSVAILRAKQARSSLEQAADAC